MLYSDGTILSKIGGHKAHCMYGYLANHPITYRRKFKNEAIKMLAYLPILASNKELGISKDRLKKLKRQLWGKIMEVLLKPLIVPGLM